MNRSIFGSLVLVSFVSVAPYMSLAATAPPDGSLDVDLNSGVSCSCKTTGAPTGATDCYGQPSMYITEFPYSAYGTCYACTYDQTIAVTAATPKGSCVNKIPPAKATELCQKACEAAAIPPAHLSISNIECTPIPNYETSGDKKALLNEAIRVCNEDHVNNALTCIHEGQKQDIGGTFVLVSCGGVVPRPK